MTSSEASLVVERVGASYAAWAELDEASRSRDAYAADKEYQVFKEDLRPCLELDSETTLGLAKPFLSSGNRYERAAAGQIVGRLGQANRGDIARACSELLFAQLLVETEDEARDDLASGLGLIWNATGDEVTPLEMARHPNANARYAAAHNLGLTTTDRPEDAIARAALELLLDDPDEGVRGWAEFGLETLSID